VLQPRDPHHHRRHTFTQDDERNHTAASREKSPSSQLICRLV
jgi:hypothetical protein